MPQVFKIGSYWVYFWVNESIPLEPIHVHVAEGKPQENATKIWITRNGHCSKAHNRSKIPEATESLKCEFPKLNQSGKIHSDKFLISADSYIRIVLCSSIY